MAHAPRRVPPPRPSTYSAVPQSPTRHTVPSHNVATATPHRGPRPAPHRYSSRRHSQQPPSSSYPTKGAIAQGVASGTIGGGFGPYSYDPKHGRDTGTRQNPRFTTPIPEKSEHSSDKPLPAVTNTQTIQPQYVWDTKDPDFDDPLHNPDPIRDAALEKSFAFFSIRGWLNATALFTLLLGLIVLFVGYPVASEYSRTRYASAGFNLGGINGTGQIPKLPNMPNLIDNDTPSDAYSITLDGTTYNLVFSDEFNVDGRSFYPGDDPFWEAVDLHYWPTGDLEWYDPSAVTTANGKLVITLSQKNTHDLNFQSAMLTSWNKLCFTTGYIEVSVSMPGSPTAPGLWPGIWTMGNLGRAGYGGTTEGMWPYSYDTCDLGTFPNQTAKDGTPTVAATGGANGGALSFLPGQRLSACTCPGSDHPGPRNNVGRGVPEIDILEAQINVATWQGQVSQSFQTAPYNYQYNFANSAPATTIYDPGLTSLNNYKGGVFQQALSAVTFIDGNYYNDQAYAPYAFEWWSDPGKRNNGYITWYSNGAKTWTATAASVGPDPVSQVNQRLIPEEPMYIIFNLGLSPSFQQQDYKHLVFPSKMYVDYIRVYQQPGVKDGLTCNPPNRPTANYINNHLNAYSNPNITTWAQAGNTFPRNSLYDGC